MSSETGPTPPSERIVGLDVLRGVALLGILLVNVRVFSMPSVVLTNPTTYGDLTGANYWVWFAGHVFAQQKFLTIFTLLFGGGVVLFTRSAERRGRSVVGLHVRRSALLVAAGLAHAYLLWYGDILVAYGLCAIVVVIFRDHAPRDLATFGVVLLAIPSLIEVASGLTMDPAAIADSWRPAESVLQSEIEAYRGGWIAQLDHRVPTAFQRQTSGFFGYSAWRVAGSMLLGMALFKWGVLTNDRSSRFYRRLILVGAASGLAAILTGVWYIEANDWSAGAALFWRQFNYWGSVPLAGAYVGIVMLFCRWRPTGFATRALAAVGRTAFSNYILQTVLATSIFYGHGLGLFGRLTRVEALGVVLLVWAVQLPLSVLWLRYFRFGPLEWLWRVLTYGERQPLLNDRRDSGADEGRSSTDDCESATGP
ncbi:DUF418 domain-containing protein [Haloterrigena salifodinae]|uniref:DUF418 domain-containing protein n=1 Tax=Haloterrigena salifodinae TaxID=2675099 RepID=A0A8T8DXU4_9EURY|nr:DUF418 domain-containing protein [Haloterrigena salifodinae]QRV14081.1 DUF418 domain-containing protein [Haloterrigena salifodinae]